MGSGLLPVAEIECGFLDSGGDSGSEKLAAIGPTLNLHVGHDPENWVGQSLRPDLPEVILPALVDTGASKCSIDAAAERLGLPVAYPGTVSGVGGEAQALIYWAQLRVPQLDIQFTGLVAGIALNSSQQTHQALIGRDFLRHFTMVYEGRTGSVKITSDVNRRFWTALRSMLFGDR